MTTPPLSPLTLLLSRHTRRRDFITLLGGAAVAPSALWPLPARAQSGKVARVGVLMNGAATEPLPQSFVAAFVQGMRQRGWVEGRNLRVDIRWNAGDAALARTYAAQLIGLMPDAILAASTTNLTVVQQATSTDTSPQSKFFMRAVEAAAPSLGVKAVAAFVRSTGDIESALQDFARQPNGGLILPTDTFTRLRSKLIAELAERHRLPSASAYDGFPKDGGLLYYGGSINLPDQFRQAAGYVDRILKGEKPGDLPVQRAVKYTLVLNLRTAKALGLTVPLPLLGLADEVIE
jgi:putative tryptophan/tyrosine transport system substrate-binding protein